MQNALLNSFLRSVLFILWNLICGFVDITCIPLTCMHGRLVYMAISGDKCAVSGLQTAQKLTTQNALLNSFFGPVLFILSHFCVALLALSLTASCL